MSELSDNQTPGATVNGGRFDAREVDGRFIIEAWLPANAHPEVVT